MSMHVVCQYYVKAHRLTWLMHGKVNEVSYVDVLRGLTQGYPLGVVRRLS